MSIYDQIPEGIWPFVLSLMSIPFLQAKTMVYGAAAGAKV